MDNNIEQIDVRTFFFLGKRGNLDKMCFFSYQTFIQLFPVVKLVYFLSLYLSFKLLNFENIKLHCFTEVICEHSRIIVKISCLIVSSNYK